MDGISQTKTKVIVDKTLFWEMQAMHDRLVAGLREQLQAERQLLHLALHELADAKDKRDHQHFAHYWLRKQKGGSRKKR